MTRDEIIHYLEQMKNGTRIIEYRNAVSAAVSIIRDLPQWIPVTARLPENGQKVVFFNYSADAVYAGKFNYIGKRGTVWFRAGKTSYPGSHWMPLPEPPKEDT